MKTFSEAITSFAEKIKEDVDNDILAEKIKEDVDKDILDEVERKAIEEASIDITDMDKAKQKQAKKISKILDACITGRNYPEYSTTPSGNTMIIYDLSPRQSPSFTSTRMKELLANGVELITCYSDSLMVTYK